MWTVFRVSSIRIFVVWGVKGGEATGSGKGKLLEEEEEKEEREEMSRIDDLLLDVIAASCNCCACFRAILARNSSMGSSNEGDKRRRFFCFCSELAALRRWIRESLAVNMMLGVEQGIPSAAS